jgi:hypothetical protein
LTELSLAGRVVALHQALQQVPHAFGGALALAYYAEPRATVDIDLNLFVPTERLAEVAAPLRDLGVTIDADVAGLIERDGQARAWWDATPIDLFFAYDAFHEAAARARRSVPFADVDIPILAPEHLMVCKVIFDRPRDWVDIDAMRALPQTIDAPEVLRWVARLAGDEDRRYERVATLLTT